MTDVNFELTIAGVTVGGLLRFKVGPSTTQVAAPAWQTLPNLSFTYGIVSTFPFASLVSSSALPLTFSGLGSYPSGVTVDSSNKAIAFSGVSVLGAYSGLAVNATDALNQSTSSNTYSVTVALGTHAPVWDSTTLLSIPQGGLYNLNTICTDQDAGDSITFSPLTSLPTGFSLNQPAGVLSVASSVGIGAYSARFRGTDLTSRVADSGNLTISVTPVTNPSIPTFTSLNIELTGNPVGGSASAFWTSVRLSGDDFFSVEDTAQ